MKATSLPPALFFTIVLATSLPAAAPRVSAPSPDEYLCDAAGLTRKTEDLLAWLKAREERGGLTKRVEKLVEGLGDDEYETRQRAMRELEQIGTLALPVLRRNQRHDDLETRRSVGVLILRLSPKEQKERNLAAPLSRAVVRVLGRAREAGVAAALLRYLPSADCMETEAAVYWSLDEIHARGGAGPALLAALDDGVAARRAVAACILARSEDAKERAAAWRLLGDRDTTVRLRTAQGMLAAATPGKEALPVLIELLREESRELAWQAEELLRFAVGRWMPREVLGSHTEAERQRCWRAWRGWWQDWGKEIDLTRLHYSGRRPGLMIAYEQAGEKEKQDRVTVWGSDGLPRCVAELEAAKSLLAVEWRPSGEMLTLRGSEAVQRNHLALRGPDGKVRWEKSVAGDFRYGRGMRMLADGRCRVWTSESASEFDVQGRETRIPQKNPRPDSSSGGWAAMGPDGLFYWGGGRFPSPPEEPEPDYVPPANAQFIVRRSDWNGEKTEFITFDGSIAGGGFVLASGEPFALLYGKKGVRHLAEYYLSGRKRRSFAHEGTPVARLWNGNTLVLLRARAVELSPDGGVAWQAFSPNGFESVQVIYPLVRFGFRRPVDANRRDLDTLASWGELLGHPLPAARRWAISQIFSSQLLPAKGPAFINGIAVSARYKPLPPEILDLVVQRLHDPDAEVRHQTHRLLSEGSNWKPVPDAAIQPLVMLLNHERDGLSAGSLLGQGNRKAIPGLLRASECVEGEKEKGTYRRRYALTALARFVGEGDDRVTKAVRAALWDEDQEVRRAVIQSFWNVFAYKKGDDFLPDFLRLLEDKDPGIAARVMWTFEPLKERGSSAIPVLKRLLSNPELRERAYLALGRVGCKDKEVFTLLRDSISPKKGTEVCVAAIDALQLHERRLEAIPTLIEALKDRRGNPKAEREEETPVRVKAMWLLHELGEKAKAAVPALIEIVKDKTEFEQVRRQALDVLAAIRDSAPVPGLVAVATDQKESDQIREWAVDSLGGIGGNDAVSALLKMIKGTGCVERRAWRALRRVPAALPHLVALAKNEKETEVIRNAALETIGLTREKSVIPAILTLAKDNEAPRPVRIEAWRVLLLLDKSAAEEADRSLANK